MSLYIVIATIVIYIYTVYIAMLLLRICSSDDALRAAKIDEQNATKRQFEKKTQY